MCLLSRTHRAMPIRTEVKQYHPLAAHAMADSDMPDCSA